MPFVEIRALWGNTQKFNLIILIYTVTFHYNSTNKACGQYPKIEQSSKKTGSTEFV